MRPVALRAMSFSVRPVESDASGRRWHWLVYDDAEGCFIRNGQTVRDRDGAESVARATIAIMRGCLVSENRR